MYKEYLAEFWYSAKALENSKVSFSVPTGGIYGEVGVNTFRNAIGAHYLPHSSEYVAPPSIDIVRPWFETIGYGKTVPAKGTLKKSVLPPRWREGYGDGEVTPYPTQVFSVNNWALKPNQPEEPPFIDHMLAICTAAKPVATKGESSKRPTGSKTGHLKRKKESSSAMDSNPSQTSASTPVVAEMHKEDQQATGGPTSLGVTSEARSNPKLSSGNDASTVSTAEVDLEKSAPSDFIRQQQGMNEGTKNTSYDHLFAEDLTKLVSSVQPSFKDLDSPKDDPIIVVDDSDEDKEAGESYLTSPILLVSKTHKLELKKNKAEAEASFLRAQPFFLNLGQLNERDSG
ncbi:hypothetical protein Tco_0715537 [Tanacetum coccineum]